MVNSVVPTQNQRWGFYGTLSNCFNEETVNEAWVTAFTKIKEIVNNHEYFCSDDYIRAYLDSTYGRHLADTIINTLYDEGEIDDDSVINDSHHSGIINIIVDRCINHISNKPIYADDAIRHGIPPYINPLVGRVIITSKYL